MAIRHETHALPNDGGGGGGEERRKLSGSYRLAIVVPAYNEEAIIAKTIKSLVKLKPARLIAVNDGSLDGTQHVLEQFPIEICNRPKHTQNYLGTPEIARAFNCGLRLLHNDRGITHTMVTGADSVLAPDYAGRIIARMEQNNAVIASGMMPNEYRTIASGSGRIVNWNWWQSVSRGLYPENYGWEHWLILKAQIQGLGAPCYRDIPIATQRPTGAYMPRERHYYHGMTLGLFHYSMRYAVSHALKTHDIFNVWSALRGYCSKRNDNYYEPEITRHCAKLSRYSFQTVKNAFKILCGR